MAKTARRRQAALLTGHERWPRFQHCRDLGALAGGEDGAAIDKFALITTEPNGLAAKIHSRMPVIVAQGDYDAWLIAEASAAQNLIRPYRAEAMKAYPISTRINSLKNNDPEIIKPAE